MVINRQRARSQEVKTGLRIDPRSVEAFECAVRRSAYSEQSISDLVPLNAVTHGVGGCEKSWTLVLRRLIDGEWPYELSRQGRAVREIFVECKEVKAIRALKFEPSGRMEFPYCDMINQADTCDIFNMSIPSGSRPNSTRWESGPAPGYSTEQP
jgi:hypothetical protein